MSPFLFATTAQILCESGSAARLAELCKERGAVRVMIVTDPGITKLGMLDSITPGFAQAGVAYDVFDAVQADPPESVVMAAVEQARALKADLVVGFGGGSSMTWPSWWRSWRIRTATSNSPTSTAWAMPRVSVCR